LNVKTLGSAQTLSNASRSGRAACRFAAPASPGCAQKLLKKFHQNFNLKSCVRTIFGYAFSIAKPKKIKVFAPLFSKSGWGAGQRPAGLNQTMKIIINARIYCKKHIL